MLAQLSRPRAALAITSSLAMTLGSMWPGAAAAFTADQASAGKTEYTSQCAQCHGLRLEGLEAPGLFGQDVMGNWDTAGGLYEFISVAMPPAAPGQLGEAAYLNVVAYIMEQNGAKADDKELTVADAGAVSLVAATKDGATAMAAANQETAIEAGDTNVPQAFTWGKELPQFKQ
ncbi:hypothetical protein DRW48_13740 [Paracoccus suum]|uniref:Cytochrome c domain-containing protein n=1 Tax=Paracoccus suum TaxID=2259340 RepID=A0A344PMK1_9RHOB|nr:c-type cytochrome [Paracoccus suum]AXC50606.1 hypothetical protein DRW48_13740 [Paracoccus suum]